MIAINCFSGQIIAIEFDFDLKLQLSSKALHLDQLDFNLVLSIFNYNQIGLIDKPLEKVATPKSA